jgi:hypothetical protein
MRFGTSGINIADPFFRLIQAEVDLLSRAQGASGGALGAGSGAAGGSGESKSVRGIVSVTGTSPSIERGRDVLAGYQPRRSITVSPGSARRTRVPV